MAKVSHSNSGKCPKCSEILNKYKGFNVDLGLWFIELQSRIPEAHISCAGRGKTEQELFLKQGTSRAKYGQSAHNYNAALDFFRLTQAGGASFDSIWYKTVLGPQILPHQWIRWYGVIEGKDDYYELPHIELRNWRKLVKNGALRLVENA